MFPDPSDLAAKAQQLANQAKQMVPALPALPALPQLPKIPMPPQAPDAQHPPIGATPGGGGTGAGVDRALLYPQNHFTLMVPALKVQVGFFTQVQGLSTQIDVLEYAEGGRNTFVHKLPTRVKQGNLTLKRGVTEEGALLRWLNSTVVKAELTVIQLTLHEADGTPIRSWSFAGAYPVKWTGPDVNAGGTEIMTESLEIAHQGAQVEGSK